MKSVKSEFPNPVLAKGRDDYIETCYFNTIFDENEIRITDENIEIDFSYCLNCDGLRTLIQCDKAIAAINVRCSGVSFGRLYKFSPDNTYITVSIPKFDVAKRIEIFGTIIAAEAMKEFRCEGEFNELYFGNQAFEVRKGDILAMEDSRVVYLDDSELEKPISSIFRVIESKTNEEDVSPEFYEEQIQIYLSEPLYKLYFTLKDFSNGSLRRYINSVIVYPVLVEAISKVCNHYQDANEEDYSDKRWFRAIEHKAEKIDINMSKYSDSYVTLADKLFGNISIDAINSFKDTFDAEVNSGEMQIIGGTD